ncbi:early nodulin-75-like [Rana temporaria]|uniref:early nodulin-75-like n=1 Tax=Rana temporaria TaxID=8407 RepID=UPI001AAC7C00|nr:early nodulin-75-like [Rana temporaria]
MSSACNCPNRHEPRKHKHHQPTHQKHKHHRPPRQEPTPHRPPRQEPTPHRPPRQEPTPHRPPRPQDVEEGEVVEIPTTGDEHVAEERPRFSHSRAQNILLQIKACSREMYVINQKMAFIEETFKDIIDDLGGN